MTELDPYAVLGVPRTATRDEIARAYRRMAKRFHPDAATSVPHASMARINDAWHVLSDAARRARWDRAHAIVQPAPWTAPRPVTAPRRPEPMQPATGRDSGWMAVAVVAGSMLVIGIVMAGIALASSPVAFEAPRMTAGPISFETPAGWQAVPGDGGQPAAHRVLVHLASYDVSPLEPCTSVDVPCEVFGDAIPAGEASVIVVAWEEGLPPVPDPLQRRVFGLNAQRIIGDEPAAFRLERFTDDAVAWWQLSPPGFPDRWIEVTASIGGKRLEQDEMLGQIEGWLATVTFEP